MVKYICDGCEQEFDEKSDYESYKNLHGVKYIDLFCGMGSFHYSFKKLGFECVMACDIYAAARNNYRLNHGMNPLGDICEISPDDIENYDVL